MVKTLLSAALVAGALVVCPLDAAAQCSDANSLWTVPLSTGAASASTSDASFNVVNPSSFIAEGTHVYSINLTGKTNWAYAATATVQNFPIPVPLKGGGEGIFLAGVDGYVVGVNASGGALWSAVDTKRKDSYGNTVCSADGVIATPTVQLYNYSNSTFQSAVADDLVMVGTRYSASCATGYSSNRIYAIKASTGQVAWVFNLTGYEMDFVSEGCAIDYSTNILYCGSNQPTNRAQPTLWAISTIDGSLVWAQNVGGIRNRPALANNKLYIGTYAGTLTVRDPTQQGIELWNVPITGTANLVRNPWSEFRTDGGHAGIVLITDSSGYLHGVNEFPPDSSFPTGRGETAWPAINGGGTITSSPALYPLVGKAYVGVSVSGNAYVHQIDLATGVDEASATVGTGTAYEPTLDVQSGTNAVNRLMVANAGTLKRYCIPWNSGWAGTSATPPPPAASDCTITGCPTDPSDPTAVGQCYKNVCDPTFKVCTKVPFADGTPCNDGQSCTCDSSLNGGGSSCPGTCSTGKCDVCRQGVCTSDVLTVNCTCSTTLGARACPGNMVCCPNGSNGGTCVDITSNITNCGGCTDPNFKGTPPSTYCADPNFERKCSATSGKGVCKRDLSLACKLSSGKAVTASQLGSANVNSPAAIVYDGFSTTGPAGPDTDQSFGNATCNAYVSQYGIFPYSSDTNHEVKATTGAPDNLGGGFDGMYNIAEYSGPGHVYTFSTGYTDGTQFPAPMVSVSGPYSSQGTCHICSANQSPVSISPSSPLTLTYGSNAPRGAHVTSVRIVMFGSDSFTGTYTIKVDGVTGTGTVNTSPSSCQCFQYAPSTVTPLTGPEALGFAPIYGASGQTHTLTIAPSVTGPVTLNLDHVELYETYDFGANVSYPGTTCSGACSTGSWGGGATTYTNQTFYDTVARDLTVSGLTVTTQGTTCSSGSDTIINVVDGTTLGSFTVSNTCNCGVCDQYPPVTWMQTFSSWGGRCGFRLTGPYECTDDMECAGLHCVNNRCVCQTSAECGGYACNAGVCACDTSGGCYKPVETQKKCHVSILTGTGACVECLTASDCSRGAPCINNKCGCTMNTDCKGTGICLSGGVCGCSANTDCPSGTTCWGAHCVLPSATCSDDGDCNQNNVTLVDTCTGGVCSSSHLSCSTNADCANYCQHQQHTLETIASAGTTHLYLQNSEVMPHFKTPGLVYSDLARPAPGGGTEQVCIPPQIVVTGAPTAGGALPTQGGYGPFNDTRYNVGPVGPVVAPMGPGGIASTSQAAQIYGAHAQCQSPDLCVWVANWRTNGDVFFLKGTNCQGASGVCPSQACSWTATELPQFEPGNMGDIYAPNDRIVAMTWGRLHNNYIAGGNRDALVYVTQHAFGTDIFPMLVSTESEPSLGYGASLAAGLYSSGKGVFSGTIFVLGSGGNGDVVGYTPHHPYPASTPCPNSDTTCEDYLASVVSISADPLFGDIYIEALDLSGHDEILVMRADDYNLRNLYDIAKETKLCAADGGDQPCPSGSWAWLPYQGKIDAHSGVRLERMVLNYGGSPSYQDLPIVQ